VFLEQVVVEEEQKLLAVLVEQVEPEVAVLETMEQLENRERLIQVVGAVVLKVVLQQQAALAAPV
jgi:hypothetical protein